MSSNRRTIGRIMMALAILITTWAGGWAGAGQPVAHAEAPGEQEIVYLEDPGAIWLFDNYHIVAVRRPVKGVTTSPLGVTTFEAAEVVDGSSER